MLEASFTKDREVRIEATKMAKRLERWLSNASNHTKMTRSQTGEFIFDAGRAWSKYSGLLILLKVKTDKAKFPAFGFLQGKPLIFLPILLAKGDLSHIHTRFGGGFQESFVHEFIHYLDYIRAGGRYGKDSVSSGDSGDYDAYVNNPKEFNAFYQQGARELERLVKSLKRSAPEHVWDKIFPNNFTEFLTRKSLIRHWDEVFVDHMDGGYRKKFIKRVHPLFKWYVGILYGETNG